MSTEYLSPTVLQGFKHLYSFALNLRTQSVYNFLKVFIAYAVESISKKRTLDDLRKEHSMKN